MVSEVTVSDVVEVDDEMTAEVTVEKEEGKTMIEQMTAIPAPEYDAIQDLLHELDWWYECRTQDDDYGRKTYTDDFLLSRDVFLISTYGWILDAYDEEEKHAPTVMKEIPTSEYEALQPVLDELDVWYDAAVTVSDDNITYKDLDILERMHTFVIEKYAAFLDSRKAH